MCGLAVPDGVTGCQSYNFYWSIPELYKKNGGGMNSIKRSVELFYRGSTSGYFFLYSSVLINFYDLILSGLCVLSTHCDNIQVFSCTASIFFDSLSLKNFPF